jgi:hypothetical protein
MQNRSRTLRLDPDPHHQRGSWARAKEDAGLRPVWDCSRQGAATPTSSQSYAKLSRMINDLKAALTPIAKQLSRITGPSTLESNLDVTKELNEICFKLKDLSIKSKISNLKTPGAQSRYRCVAGINAKLKTSLVKLDDLMLILESPEEPMYQALFSNRENISGAAEIASERTKMIFRADMDPKNGWPALTMYEEKGHQGKGDAEKDKLFASCLKQVQDSRKKKASGGSKTFFQKDALSWTAWNAAGHFPIHR